MNMVRGLSFLLTCLLLAAKAVAQNSPAPVRLIEFVLTPDAKDWNYKVNEMASVQVRVLKFGVPIEDVVVDYETGPEMLPADKKETLVLKKGQGRIAVGTSNQPGFRQLLVKTTYKGNVYSDRIKVAYSPEKIKPTVPMPDDFKRFWETAKAEAGRVPMDVVLTPLPQYSTPGVAVFLVNLQNYKKGQRLYGYLCKPKAPGIVLSGQRR